MTLAQDLTHAAQFLNPKILLSPFQMRIISDAVARHGFAARFLVYGCGHDSAYWHALNRHGHTLFIEQKREWIENTRRNIPGISIEYHPFSETTVATSLGSNDIGSLDRAHRPHWVMLPWDIVLIDGPTGYEDEQPGRALPIYWAALHQRPDADIFVDDYQRSLEKRYCDILLRGSDNSVTLPGRSSVFWRIGAQG